MMKTKTVQIEQEVVTECICDKCEKVIPVGEYQWGPYGDVAITFNYGSDFDDERWKGQLCDECAKKILGFLRKDPDTQKIFVDQPEKEAGNDSRVQVDYGETPWK